MEGKGNEGKGREREGREEELRKGREGKARQGKAREGKGREGKEREERQNYFANEQHTLIHLPKHLYKHPPTNPPIYTPTYLPTHPLIYPSTPSTWMTRPKPNAPSGNQTVTSYMACVSVYRNQPHVSDSRRAWATLTCATGVGLADTGLRNAQGMVGLGGHVTPTVKGEGVLVVDMTPILLRPHPAMQGRG